MSLIKEVNPDARRRGTVFDFAIGKLFEELSGEIIYYRAHF